MFFFFFKQKTAYEITEGDWSSDVCSSDLTIGMLALTEGGAGLALGMTAPFFNVYFARELGASTAAIGLIFGAGSIVTAFATLLAPVVVRRLGRVRTVAFLKLFGVPFLVLIGLAPGVVTA